MAAARRRNPGTPRTDAASTRRKERDRRDDGLPGKEGAFPACSFWYVE